MALSKRRAVLGKLLHGCHATANPFALDEFQADIVQNFHIDRNGIARSRKGSRLLNDTALDGAVTSIFEYRRPDGSGTKTLVLVTAGRILYEWNPTTLSFDLLAYLSSANRPTWAVFYDGSGNSNAFMANGVDFIRYNGFGTAGVRNAATSYPWTSNPRYIMEYDSRMLAAGCDSDPYVVWVSASLDGTDWTYGDPDAGQYWQVKSSSGDRVTGLGRIYDFAVILQSRATTIITGADPTDDTTQQITVSDKYGTTSQWSVSTVGNVIRFSDENHIYKGILRDAIENGLLVSPIDEFIIDKYRLAQNTGDVQSVYDARNDEILWGIKSKPYGKYDMALVYNIELSNDEADVWSGWFSGVGYEPYTFGVVTDADDGKPRIWRGDDSGHVYAMEEPSQYKDELAAADKNIPFIIRTAPLMPYGMGALKRAREIYLYLSQFVDASTYIQWLLDGRYSAPSTARYEDYRGWVPLIRAANSTSQVQTIGNMAVAEEGVLPCAVTINQPFHWVQFTLRNDGSNTRDSVTYAGGELYYQPYRQRREVG